MSKVSIVNYYFTAVSQIINDAFYKRKTLQRGKLNKTLKKRIIKSVVKYGSETWIMKRKDVNRLDDLEMRI